MNNTSLKSRVAFLRKLTYVVRILGVVGITLVCILQLNSPQFVTLLFGVLTAVLAVLNFLEMKINKLLSLAIGINHSKGRLY